MSSSPNSAAGESAPAEAAGAPGVGAASGEPIEFDRWPGRTPQDRDRSAGIEYIILGLVLLVGATLVSERVQRLLWMLYDPFVIFVLVLVFSVYLVLKSRDRTYALEREIDLMRRKRLAAEDRVEDAVATIDALLSADEAAAPTGASDEDSAETGEALGDWEERAREELGALRERLREPS